MAASESGSQRLRRITAVRAEDALSVLAYFEAERTSNQRRDLQNPRKRTAEAMGLSVRSVDNIVKKKKEGTEWPDEDDPEVRDRPMMAGEAPAAIIRNKIWAMRRERKKVTSRVLMAYLESLPATRNAGWKWSQPTLCRYLKRLGYQFKKRRGYYEVLQEKPTVKRQVARYIRKIRELREAKKKIYYQDETWVYTNQVCQYDWINDDDELLPQADKNTNGPGARSIVTAVIGPKGVLQQSVLLFRGAQDKRKDVDYHSDMNSAVFLDWLEKKVFPHIKGCVLCVDRASYHTTLTDKTKPPTAKLKKAEVIDYILQHAPSKGKSFTRHELEAKILAELRPVAKAVKPDGVMKVTELAKKFNVEIVMLPVAHPNLNLIEFVWARVKTYVCNENQVQTLLTAENKAEEELRKVNGDAYASILKKKVQKYEDEIMELYQQEDQDDDDDSSDGEEEFEDDDNMA